MMRVLRRPETEERRLHWRAVSAAGTVRYHCGSSTTEDYVPHILQPCPVDGIESLMDQFMLEGSIC